MNQNIKRDRFLNVASKRVQRIIDDIDLLANCANKKNYDYGEEDVKKMLCTIKSKIRNLESVFNQENSKNSKSVFKF